MNKRLAFLIIVSSVLYFANLGGSSIYILDEAKNAGCAMEMLQRGDLVVPTFNGNLRTDKPPLHYFFMMAAYQVDGITPFAARFFSALAGVLLIVLVYKKVSVLIDEVTAFFSSLVLLSSLQLAVQFHLAVPDPYLILLLTYCLLTFFIGFKDGTRKIYWAYAAAALAFLTKGLIAIVFPGSIFFLYLLLSKQMNWVNLRRLRLPLGILIFLLIALPWYVAVGIETQGEWLKGFFIQHNIDRYTATMEGHRGFPLAPFAILIGALLPFSVFVVQAITLAIKKRNESPFLLYCLIIVTFIATFFSFSKTILPSYPAPALSFMAIILGYYLKNLMESSAFSKWKLNLSFGVSVIISLAIPTAVYIALSFEKQLVHLKFLAGLFVVIPIGIIAGWYLFYKRREYFVYSWAGSWIMASLLFFYVAFPKVDMENPVVKSLPLITTKYSDYRVIAYGHFNPAYVFQFRKTIEVIYSADQLHEIESTGEKVVVITQSRKLDELKGSSWKEVYRCKDLFENTETVLLTH